jgi:SAM-dependent methyltransferase
MTAKRYDAAYFERFYLDPKTRVLSPAERRRRVKATLAICERFLDRPLRSVLDVGCGLGLWGRELVRHRPRLRYVGIEPSAAATRRAVRSGLDVRQGELAELDRLVGKRTFDLVICADVLHYLEEVQVRAAVASLAARTHGLAQLEVLTNAEGVEGDLDDMKLRAPDWYRRLFRRNGLEACGLHLYLAPPLHDVAAALEVHSRKFHPRV